MFKFQKNTTPVGQSHNQLQIRIPMDHEKNKEEFLLGDDSPDKTLDDEEGNRKLKSPMYRHLHPKRGNYDRIIKN